MIVVCRRSVADLTQMINTILAETTTNDKMFGILEFLLDKEGENERRSLGCRRNCGFLLWLARSQNVHYESKCDREPGGVYLPLPEVKARKTQRFSFVSISVRMVSLIFLSLLVGKAKRATPPNKDFKIKLPTMFASRGVAKHVTQQMLFGAAQHHPVIVFERWLCKRHCTGVFRG